MTIKHRLLLVLVFFTTTLFARQKIEKDLRTLIVFFDGLRPDYITPEVMPNLYAFSKAGCYGKQHHSVFPTVTRVNASSYASGSYPGTHGILGNTVYFPAVDPKKGLNTGDYVSLNKIAASNNGHLLTATSLGEVLQKAGQKMMVFSSGSTGQAMLQNHTANGAIVNPGLILPESFKETLLREVGPIPEEAEPNTAQHKWITDALIRYGLTLDGPLVSAIWYSDPDGAAHSHGIGAPESVASLKIVDTEFGRIMSSLKEKNLDQNFNIIISADHGFITYGGKQSVTEFLISQDIMSRNSDEILDIGGAIYVKNHDTETIRKIVEALQTQEWVGPIFTKSKKPGDMKGSIEGTLSFESVHWYHPVRGADILVEENWNDGKNDKGYAGMSFSRGVAGHGGISPYEVHIALFVSGPGFKKSFESELPTSNVDIVPTILSIHGLPIPPGMDGRVMTEFLSGTISDNNLKPKEETIITTAEIPGGRYTLTLHRTILGKYQYVDFAKVERVRN